MKMEIHIQNATITLPLQQAALLSSVESFIAGEPASVVAAAPAAHSSVPAFGEPWPEQGGTLIAQMPALDGRPAYYLVVADASAELAWGQYGTTVEGLSDIDGLANTKILAAGDHPAAKYCAELKVGEHQDYYLMSNREASLIRAISPQVFAPGWHWTSTQYSANNAFIQYFADGHQYFYDKVREYLVRPVRRVTIQ